MHQLAIVPPIAVPMCLADAEIAAALSFAELEKSEGTRRAYRSDFRIFATWCSARGLTRPARWRASYRHRPPAV